MADTVRTTSALQALAPDNTTAEISPQDLRDIIVSAVNKADAQNFITHTDTNSTTEIFVYGKAGQSGRVTVGGDLGAKSLALTATISATSIISSSAPLTIETFGSGNVEISSSEGAAGYDIELTAGYGLTTTGGNITLGAGGGTTGSGEVTLSAGNSNIIIGNFNIAINGGNGASLTALDSGATVEASTDGVTITGALRFASSSFYGSDPGVSTVVDAILVQDSSGNPIGYIKLYNT